MHKPTIAMRKYDETQFVNVRTYWSLCYTPRAGGSTNPSPDAATYELQVRHGGDEDAFVFMSHRASERDELELVTATDRMLRIANIRQHEDMSLEDAAAWLEDKVAIIEPFEARILEHLHKTWDAFVLLFEPSINL